MFSRRQTLKGIALGSAAVACPFVLRAQETPKVRIGMSGWTGFAPLTLALEAGLFDDRGVDVETVFLSQSERLTALEAGSIDGVATTVDTQILWSERVPLTQVLVIDKSKGGDGIAVRKGINGFSDLKGKSVACDAPGTSPYFMLCAMLRENKMSPGDLELTALSPKDAAEAFVAGKYDAAVTYEPYLAKIRSDPNAGKVLATTLEYPVVIDTLAFPARQVGPQSSVYKRVVEGFFAALEMIQSKPGESYRIMGARVGQTADQFKASAAFVEWLDKKKNQDFFADGFLQFMELAAEIQLDSHVITETPDLANLTDARFIT